jgi:hypothetical protein
MTKVWFILIFGLIIMSIGIIIGVCIAKDEVDQDTGKWAEDWESARDRHNKLPPY